jgi:hypothetical protein
MDGVSIGRSPFVRFVLDKHWWSCGDALENCYSPVVEELTIGCQNCGAVLQVGATERTMNCPYCDHPSVVERPATPNRPDPEFALGFVLPQKDAFERATQWMGASSIFARSDFKRAPLEKMRSVYLPAYLYGAVARSSYSAEIGENYTETETYTTTENGKTVTRTRTVVKTEWRSLQGAHGSYVRDILVTASNGIPNDELEAVEPFDLRALRRYEPAMISGWASEEPSLSREDCVSSARGEALDEVGRKLSRFMPGDSCRGLQHQTRLEEEVIDLVLLPLWVFAVHYSEKKEPIRILVNGQTGEVGGSVPISVIKVVLAVIVAIAAIVGIYLGVQS